MAKKKKENKPEKVKLTSEILKVNVRQLSKELEEESGVKVLSVSKARTETPRGKNGNELKPKVYPTEVELMLDKKPTKAKLGKLQKIVDSHEPRSNKSKEDLLAEAKKLLKQLDSLR